MCGEVGRSLLVGIRLPKRLMTKSNLAEKKQTSRPLFARALSTRTLRDSDGIIRAHPHQDGIVTHSSYSSCITFYAPDIIPRKSMEGHGPSPSSSLRAGALSSFSTLSILLLLSVFHAWRCGALVYQNRRFSAFFSRRHRAIAGPDADQVAVVHRDEESRALALRA